MEDLEQRLQSHARAFEGLMSLIPAKHYYAQDNSEQWSQKKKTKVEKRAAKRAKLDPKSHKSVKDVMDENERKRKRELGIEEDEPSDLDAPGKEQPREGMKPLVKKQKKESNNNKKADSKDSNANLENERSTESSEKKRLKAEAKAQKRKEQQERRQEKEQTPQDAADNRIFPADKALILASEPSGASKDTNQVDTEARLEDDEMDHMDTNGLVEEVVGEHSGSTVTRSPTPGSPASVTSAIPSTSSSSSIVPPANPDISNASSADDPLKDGLIEKPEKPAKIPKLPNIDHDILKARLQARLDQLRAARKADGLDGKPAKNRQELLEARRRKQEQRKAHKKELRKQAKEDEQRTATEAELARLRGSGSPLTGSDIFSPRRDDIEQNFTFSRVKFNDGEQMNSGLSSLIQKNKKKGPPDAKTALGMAERKNSRIASLDETKRSEIEEKEAWLNAKKKAHGEKVRDDVDLLKKTLKRKEKQKQRSEKDWNERIRGVEKGKEMRQKKREENIRKRMEEKGSKKGKGVKKPGKKPKGRAGFEGTVRSKAR